MSRGTLNTDDTLNGLLTKDGVAETVSDVGKLLCIRHLYLPVVSTIMIIVIGNWTILEEFLVPDFLGL